MGTDSRDVTLDRGRSDAMIVVSYNSKTGSVKLTSLLRDSLVPIEGVGWNRINTAYFFGGVGLAVNTVNQLYNLDI
jgi:anionic cell wall polymer biosynthesis LytR-Cps2A-Psr (LCP) family protein